MKYYVYILQSLKDGRTYTGYTENLETRLYKHNSGQVRATRHRRPLKMIFFEEFKKIQDAKKQELWWKSSSGRRKLKDYFNKGKINIG
jgi:putative endonuclease